MTYYIEKDGKIVLSDTDKTRFENTLQFMPQFSNLEVKETDQELATKSETETKLDEIDQQARALDQRISELKDDLLTATLANNEDWIKDIKTRYGELING